MANSEIITDDPKPKDPQDHHNITQSSRPLFDLTPLLKTPPEVGEIHLCAHSESVDEDRENFQNRRGNQILAFATKSGDLILLRARNGEPPVVKKVPWYLDPDKTIVALSFDPSGAWLLVVGADASFSLVPVITIITGTSSGVVSRHGWATGDITSFPPLTKDMHTLHPTCVAWWENAQWGPVAVLGGDHGEVIFIDLATGTGVGTTNVAGSVKSLNLCHDNTLDSVFLLITNVSREQWKLLLEQRKCGYCWPLDRADIGGSMTDLAVGSYGSVSGGGLGVRGAPLSIPARSRLQGLKQLSVEKLSIIKQKLAESRKGGSISVGPQTSSPGGLRLRETSGDDGSLQKKSEVKSSYLGNTNLSQSNMVRNTSLTPEKLGLHLGETFISPQNSRGRSFLSGYYTPSSLLTVHTMGLEIVPIYIHRLPPLCQDVLLTDRFIFITNQSSQILTVVSCQLSESSLEGNSEYNPESVVQNFKFLNGERVLAMYKKTGILGTRRGEEHGLRGGGTLRGSGSRHGGSASGASGGILGKKGVRLGQGVSQSSDWINLNVSLDGSNGAASGGSLGIRKSSSMGHGSNSSLSFVQNVEHKKNQGQYVETIETDTCIAVTTSGAYELQLRQCPTELFLDLALKKGELEEAERVAQVFGLNLQHLLEIAGDLELASKSFTQAISFYKLSRCRPLKSVLKFAAGGHSVELLGFIETVFGASNAGGGGTDLSPSERIHLSNLAVMAHVERVLRASAATLPSSSTMPNSSGNASCSTEESNFGTKRMKRAYSPSLLGKFLRFLHDNQHYDEVLAVSVAGQTALWEPLKFLCSHRGLYREALSSLSRFLRSVAVDGLKSNENAANKLGTNSNTFSPVAASLLDSGLWECLSEPSILQPLLEKPELASVHINFVNTFLPILSIPSLQRLAVLYDPSSPVFSPCLQKMFTEHQKSQPLGLSPSGGDSLDDSSSSTNPVGDMIEMYVKVMLHLCHKRSDGNPQYSPELMDWNGPRGIGLSEEQERQEYKNQKNNMSKEHARGNLLTAGYAHAALVWNHGVLTWGNAAQGCLGHGPTMSRYSFPQDVSSFPNLGVEVLNVSCGRQHTLALTTNGVYAWGSAQFGQIGIGMSSGQSPYPSLVETLWHEQIVEVSAGQYHSMALTEDGRVYTWGWGVYGQLGHGDVEDCVVPTIVKALLGKVKITRICGGHCHSLALTTEGSLMAWGSSVFGQLGHGAMGKSSLPVYVHLPERITMMTTAYFHNLAVGVSNRLYSWGSSPQVLRLQAQAQKKARLILHQQLQQQRPLSPQKPNINGRKPPVKMQSTDQTSDQTLTESNPNGSVAVDARTDGGTDDGVQPVEEATRNEGESSQAATTAEGESQAHLLPSVVDTTLVLGPITQISCGCHHSALLTKDGTVYTWGRSLDGQVGNGTRREAPIPAPLTSPPPAPPPAPPPPNSSTTLPILTRLRASHIACGCEFTLALENSSGKLWAWGSNSLAQLGKDLDDDSRSAIEGKVVVLKTTKRVVKLPHGAQNSSDLPYLVPWLPPVVQGIAPSEDAGKDKSSLLRSVPQGKDEIPPYGHLTLHKTLEFFHKHYNSQRVLSSCLELENYQAAAKLVALESHFHQALAYQLKALYLASKSNFPPVRKEKKGRKVAENSTKTVRRDTCKAGGDGGSIGRVDEEDEEEELVKSGVEVSYSGSRRCETHSFAIQGGAEEMSEVGGDGSNVPTSPCPCIQEEEGRDGVAEVVVNIVSALSLGEGEVGLDNGISEKVEDSPLFENNIGDKEEQMASKFIERSGTLFVQDDGEEKNDNLQNELSFSRKALCLQKLESLAEGNISREGYIVNVGNGIEGGGTKKGCEDTHKLNVLKPEEELACRASVVVEHYASLLEEEGHLMIRRLLEQGINFWLAHSLPLGCLETLLIKHMSKFFYPLGLMLFCDGNADPEGEIGMAHSFSNDEKGGASYTAPGSILGQLSTRFCLQLCSTLLSHIRHKKVAYPEYVELLAQVMAMQAPFTRDNGGGPPSSNTTQAPILSPEVSYTPEHAMEAVLENLGLVGAGIDSTLGPSPIHVTGDAVLDLLGDQKRHFDGEGKEDVEETSRKSEEISGEAVVFSCGHHFRADRFHQNVLPETELALLGLHHPLPHTARLVRGLFSAAVAPKHAAASSLPPTLQLACPNCVLSHLQAQV